MADSKDSSNSDVTSNASEVCREESRNGVMMGSNQSTTEGPTLSAIGPPYPPYDNRSRKRRQWCDHCRKPGQTKDTRWKIHKKPVNWKPSRPQPERENGGHNATTEDSPASPTNNPFGKEQIEALKKLFSHRSQIPQCHWNKICGTKKLTF